MNTQLLLIVSWFFSPIWFYFTIATLMLLIRNKIDSKGRLSIWQIKTIYRLAGACAIVLLAFALDFYWDIDVVEQASWDGYLHSFLALSYVSVVFFRYYLVLSYPFEQKKPRFCATCHGRGKLLQEVTKTYWWSNGFVVDVEEQTCPNCNGKGIESYAQKGTRFEQPPSLQKQPKDILSIIRRKANKSKSGKKTSSEQTNIDWIDLNLSIAEMAARHEHIAQTTQGERVIV